MLMFVAMEYKDLYGSGDSHSRFAGAEFGASRLDVPSHYDVHLFGLRDMVGGRLWGVAGPKVQCRTLTGNGYNDAWASSNSAGTRPAIRSGSISS